MNTPNKTALLHPTTEAHGLNSGVPGMTERNYIATHAMVALIGAGMTSNEAIADEAFDLADAMMRRSNK